MANVPDTPTSFGQFETKDLLDILNIFDDSIVIFDAKWRYTFINITGWQVINRPKAEVIGQNVWQLLPHLKGTKFEKAARQAMRNQEVLEIDEYYPHRQMFTHTKFYPTKKFLLVQITDTTALVREQTMNNQLMGDLQYAMEVYWSDRNRQLRDKHKSSTKSN